MTKNEMKNENVLIDASEMYGSRLHQGLVCRCYLHDSLKGKKYALQALPLVSISQIFDNDWSHNAESKDKRRTLV